MSNEFETLMAESGRQARPQQIKLVKLGRESLEDSSSCFIQAGTGTGKSWALLGLAKEASRINQMPSVIVTPTLALMDQYWNHDVPDVRKYLGGEYALLKGRGNYLCTQSVEGRKLKASEANEIFNKVVASGQVEWAKANLTGWGCTGDCNPKFGDQCGLQIAKDMAAKADVIISNGSLLLWDLKVDQMTAGVARLLPAYGALFVDECHELDNVAKNCNSDQIGPNSSVYDAAMGLKAWVMKKADSMGRFENELLIKMDPELAAMVEEANQEAGRLESQIAGMSGDPEAYDEIKSLRKELKSYERFIGFATSDDDRFISTISKEKDPDGQDIVMLNRKCIDASSWTRPILTGQTSVLVSGTIPVTLPRRLGVGKAPISDVGTPFEYSKSVLAISSVSAARKDRDANPTREAMRIKEVCRAVVGMSGKSHEEGGGGSLVLFTSWRDFDDVMPLIEREIRAAGLDVPVLGQSRGDQQETARNLETFKAHGHAVMGGVQSLWTGVDVPGNALRQVVVFQLPWPVRTQEMEAIMDRFGFQVYADEMMTRLVQGIGRLVRTPEDNGRVYIADSRAKDQLKRKNSMNKHVAEFAPYSK